MTLRLPFLVNFHRQQGKKDDKTSQHGMSLPTLPCLLTGFALLSYCCLTSSGPAIYGSTNERTFFLLLLANKTFLENFPSFIWRTWQLLQHKYSVTPEIFTHSRTSSNNEPASQQQLATSSQQAVW